MLFNAFGLNRKYRISILDKQKNIHMPELFVPESIGNRLDKSRSSC